jgi:response regulator RpfG family c-di-GMP phosphodiesterase
MAERPRVLIVDDEPLVLEALRRQHGQRFALVLAVGAAAALARIEAGEHFAVVVSDYEMPGMDGIEFLEHMCVRAPQTVRVMLTGQADVRVATEAVNRVAIFKFLTKPCDQAEFARTLTDALEQHRVIVAERRLLEDTLAGCVRVLCEVLTLAVPDAFGRASRVRELAHAAAIGLCPNELWVVDTAATLFQIGMIAVPPDLLQRGIAGAPLESGERDVLARVPETGAHLLQVVPRLEPVADLIRLQRARFDATSMPIGARILAAAIALDERLQRGEPRDFAVAALRADPGRFDPLALDHLHHAAGTHHEARQRQVLRVRQLKVGMVLDQDVVNSVGAIIVPRGHELSPATLARLLSYINLGTVREPICVLARTPIVVPPPLPVSAS